MNKEERENTVKKLGKAIEKMPNSKREYLLGFAEGVLAAHKPEKNK